MKTLLTASLTLSVALMIAISSVAPSVEAAQEEELPYTFFFTHYELLGIRTTPKGGDGISLTGGDFNFTDFSENEMSLEGVMFYSTDPASSGHVLTPRGHTVRKTAAVASPTATVSSTALADTGGAPVVLAASLALMVSGLAALKLVLWRNAS
jgi:hypothetical protein